MNSQATSTTIQAVTADRELFMVPPALWEQARARSPVLKVLTNETGPYARARGDGSLGDRLRSHPAYELLKRYRKDPRLSSLLPQARGRKAGGRWLGVDREEIVRI